MNLETWQDSGAGKVVSTEIKRSEEGEEMKDSMRAGYAPHPEHSGMEGFLEGQAVLPGPDSSHEAKSFQQVCQSCLGLSKAPLRRKELECSNLSSPAFLDSDPTVCLAFLGLHSKPLTTKGQKGE